MALVVSEAQRAVSTTGRRLVELLRSPLDPAAPAIGSWTAGEVAAHLSHVFAADAFSASEGAVALPGFLPDGALERALGATSIGDVSRMNDAMLVDDPERDPRTIADRIERSLSDLEFALASAPADRVVTWLGGAQLPLVAVAGHLLFEANLHGTDLDRSWRIDPGDVRIIFDGFLANFMNANPGMMGGVTGTGRIEVRLRGQTRAHLVFGDGGVRVEPATRRPVDMLVSADPATFLLVMAGRASGVSASLRGRVVAWGRHPIRGMRLMSMLRSP